MHSGSEAVRRNLIEVAKSRGTTSYSEIAPLAGIDIGSLDGRTRIARILEHISRTESEHGRPLMSALVVLKGKKLPGQGFFNLARQLRSYDGDDNMQFWKKEVSRVHDYWSNQE